MHTQRWCMELTETQHQRKKMMFEHLQVVMRSSQFSRCWMRLVSVMRYGHIFCEERRDTVFWERCFLREPLPAAAKTRSTNGPCTRQRINYYCDRSSNSCYLTPPTSQSKSHRNHSPFSFLIRRWDIEFRNFRLRTRWLQFHCIVSWMLPTAGWITWNWNGIAICYFTRVFNGHINVFDFVPYSIQVRSRCIEKHSLLLEIRSTNALTIFARHCSPIINSLRLHTHRENVNFVII